MLFDLTGPIYLQHKGFRENIIQSRIAILKHLVCVFMLLQTFSKR